MHINRRQVMTTAWALVRGEMQRDFRFIYDWTPGPTYGQRRETTAEEKRAVFAAALRRAWATVKDAARITAERRQTARPVAELRAMIENLENTDTLAHAGLQRLSELRSELADAEARDRAEKRGLIEAERGRIVAVTFTKKDGSLRTMKVQPAALRSRVKGEAASEAARKAVETRAANNPHLLNVWDVEKGAPRSINLATVSRIAAGGEVHTFA